jgi:hypothetical protein
LKGDRMPAPYRAGWCKGEHEMPSSWECVAWKAAGGYSSQKKKGDNGNKHRERIWFSPHCLGGEQGTLL